jgi:hypothetical protein
MEVLNGAIHALVNHRFLEARFAAWLDTRIVYALDKICQGIPSQSGILLGAFLRQMAVRGRVKSTS